MTSRSSAENDAVRVLSKIHFLSLLQLCRNATQCVGTLRNVFDRGAILTLTKNERPSPPYTGPQNSFIFNQHSTVVL